MMTDIKEKKRRRGSASSEDSFLDNMLERQM